MRVYTNISLVKVHIFAPENILSLLSPILLIYNFNIYIYILHPEGSSKFTLGLGLVDENFTFIH
jgi:hypothetical protein